MTANTCPTCQRPLPADAPLCPVCALLGASAKEDAPTAGMPPLEEIQAAFPELEVLECIGRGGMGIVYKARQPHLDRLVALKILAPELGADPGFAERFSREARTLAKLSHPHIVGIHDYGQRGDHCFLTMEYVDGVNLRQAMRAARFTPEQALALIPDLCGALQFAHDHGVLHRDIKPENILIDTRGRVKLADFGIAQLIGEGPGHLTLTATGSALGSAAYMAPEQIEASGEIDHRADIYSLGVVFYEMLTGGLPLGRFPLPSEKSTAPAGIDDVVLRALEKERDRRYQSADAVRSGIDGASTHKPTQPVKRAADSMEQQRRITRWSLGLSGGGLIGAMVGLVTSPVILGFGAVAFIIGIIGCWWLVIGMKSGRYRVEHRTLLLGTAILPVLAGVVGWLVVSQVAYFPDVIYSEQPWPLLWILVPFAMAVLLCKLPLRLVALRPGEDPSRRVRRFRRWAPVLGTGTLLLSLLIGKHLKAQLDPLAKYHSASFIFRDAKTYGSLSERDLAAVEAAAARAAGEYAAFYQIEFPVHGLDMLSIGFTDRGRWSSERCEQHHASFSQRLRASLPERIRMDRAGDGARADDVSSLLMKLQGYGMEAITVLFGAGAILIIFSGKRATIVCFILGTISVVALQVAPSWPTPSILPPSLEGRPALPELPALENDLSTAELMLDSLIRAAKRKDREAVLNAFAPGTLSETDLAALPQMMKVISNCDQSRPHVKGNLGYITVFLKRYGTQRNIAVSMPLPIASKDGEWRIHGDLSDTIRQMVEWDREAEFAHD
ncbi:serine/threonine protein kinase [Luteolibacter flavescens]|uniref:Serine/threonine protein kinase n=1 Tax=Luteolibacter flavescens TaxID=1859460 RepID=A0ABT3FKQ6_9BACT|nr:serine/threonine protein kinase [Luteolibacter flavescens]